MISFGSLESGEDKIAVVGLGYVGLPLAVALSRYFKVVGYDLKTERIQELAAERTEPLKFPGRNFETLRWFLRISRSFFPNAALSSWRCRPPLTHTVFRILPP